MDKKEDIKLGVFPSGEEPKAFEQNIDLTDFYIKPDGEQEPFDWTAGGKVEPKTMNVEFEKGNPSFTITMEFTLTDEQRNALIEAFKKCVI